MVCTVAIQCTSWEGSCTSPSWCCQKLGCRRELDDSKTCVRGVRVRFLFEFALKILIGILWEMKVQSQKGIS